MKIYFCGSIRGGREDVAVYEAMIAFLRSFGEVLTEHVGNRELSEAGDDGPSDRYIHDRDMAWLEGCDIVVAEISVSSLGVGYELGWAAAFKKPILCLYREIPGRSVSAMIAGSRAMETAVYVSMDEARDIIRKFMAEMKERVGEAKR